MQGTFESKKAPVEETIVHIINRVTVLTTDLDLTILDDRLHDRIEIGLPPARPIPSASVVAEISAQEPWAYMMNAVRQYAENISHKDSTDLQKDDIQLSFYELFPGNELPMWAPQMVTENSTLDDQRAASTRSKTDNAEAYCATSFNLPFDGDDSIIEIEVLDSPTSSVLVENVSFCSSEAEEITSNGSGSTFGSLSEDYSKGHVEVSSVFNSLATDKERDDHIRKLAEEFKRDWGFDFEFSSNDGTFPGPSSVMDCNEGTVVAINMDESVFLSRRSFEGGDADQSFNPLFDGQDGMIEFENLVDDEHTMGDADDQSHDLNCLDQERREKQWLSAQRHSIAIRLNPFLSHLFN
ncbi:uncharacterized protein MELLADRAFT_107658 [Melampsora larici-populina 98AG31]|uniref:Uncharacterized protein n=1 Tax=Melampsora larici-populina (strain 98AG31 / pathotype 3-4-7) TaxID=747676 RepID=F4RQC2_MELLP|nr:uncharacterized protein MELLADRAFT_107658 [Melampsora larici-populina 98AG31]EGG05381.1 hypothetical protein MELLADRAFT_107658 [Melampsora larici-populina 98AG31]